MKKILSILAGCASLFVVAETPNTATPESLPLIRFENLGAMTGPAKLPSASGKFQSYMARNSETSSRKKSPATDPGLAINIFENTYASNAATNAGPGEKNTAYTLLAVPGKKGQLGEYNFSQLAFFDSTTLVAIARHSTGTELLLIDIAGEQLYLTGILPVPDPGNTTDREILFIDRDHHRIFLAINGADALSGKTGELSWKKSKSPQPGIWIIEPVKNEEKKWAFNMERIGVYYFKTEALAGYAKNGLSLSTIHAGPGGHIWLGFSDGLIGVLPKLSGQKLEFGENVHLYNLNKDISWVNTVRTLFAAKMQDRLRNGYDPEVTDTAKLFKHLFSKPEAYTGAYLQDARNTVFYNLVQTANAQLDSDRVVQNEESYWQYVHLDLDNPLHKNKQKLYDYAGFKVRKYQTLQNSFASGDDNGVYATTNLGLFKMTFDEKKSSISVVWSTPYANSFLRSGSQDAASSGTTPAFNAGHQEVAICDNDFPYSHLLILDAKSGRIKHQFTLFDRAYGSACRGGIVYSGNTIFVANAFGNDEWNSSSVPNYPASGLMKFSSTTRGNWHIDYDWNTANRPIIANSATPKTDNQGQVYIYHQPGTESPWQVTRISTEKPKGLLPATISLVPDLSQFKKLYLDNDGSNLLIGPQKSLFIGTTNGLLRVNSD